MRDGGERTGIELDPVCTTGCGLTIRSDLTLWSATGGTFVAEDNGATASPYSATADWQALTSSQQSELIRLSACLQTGGAIQPVTFEVYDGYQRRTLARREVPNNVDFASLVEARD